jgi:hypothetical protein
MSLRTLPLFPILILPLAITLLQWHSVPFWQAQVGFWPGLGWSVLLELISLWVWFRPGRRRRSRCACGCRSRWTSAMIPTKFVT